MTRNWMMMASRTLTMVRSGSASPRRRRVSPCLENLEYRLSLSSVGCKMQPADLNPQPLPPGYVDREPDPMIVGNHIGTSLVVARKH